MVSCSQTTEYRTDLNRELLNGRVASFTETSGNAVENFGEWVPKAGHFETTLKVTFDKDGIQESSKTYNEGKLTERSLFKKEKGKIVEELYYGEDGNLDTVKKSLSISKDKVTINTYKSDGELSMKQEVFFKKNQLIKSYITEAYDDVIVSTNEYNDRGNLISLILVLQVGGGEVVRHIKFEYLSYDDMGNWTKSISQNVIEEYVHLHIRAYEYY